MAHKQGTRYPNEFKQQIVVLHHLGSSVTQLANEHGLVAQTIYKRIKNYSPIIKTDDGEIISAKDYKELQKRIAQLEMENDILKIS